VAAKVRKPKTVGARTGGRSERVVREVLEATLDQLARDGYAALRTEDVAERAGVAKTTVWRRWPTKADLVHAAIMQAKGDDELPDFRNLRLDLFTLVERVLEKLKTPAGRAIARLVTNEGGDPDVDRLARKLREEARGKRAELVRRAVEREELPLDTDVYLVVDMVFAPLISGALRWNEWPTDERIARVIDLAVTGAEHGGGSSDRGTRAARSGRADRRDGAASAARSRYRGGSGGSRR
jgi:AcrR family transcriptional regulator